LLLDEVIIKGFITFGFCNKVNVKGSVPVRPPDFAVIVKLYAKAGVASVQLI
jgi:hypothetical protein